MHTTSMSHLTAAQPVDKARSCQDSVPSDRQSCVVLMGRIALRHQRSDTGNEFTAVFHRVCERVIAVDE